MILQIGDLRVTCAWPPFSDAWEITVVRPVAYLSLSDYEIEPELRRRLSTIIEAYLLSVNPALERPRSPRP